MARQIITKLLDDLDGGEADETVSFAMDGVAYTIDLSARNASEFRELMARFQDAGTRTGRSGSPAQLKSYGKPVTHMASVAAQRDENTKIRKWAEENGYDVSDRGRIPINVVEAFRDKVPHPSKVAADAAEAKAAAVAVEGTSSRKPRRKPPALQLSGS
jgi:hypothetical protein